MNLALFVSTVLIWGTTWIAISFQVGEVPVTVSVFWRFLVSGLFFLLVLAAMGRLKLPSWYQQPWILAQALCLFSFNFLCFYTSAEYIATGLISIVFSLATVFNVFNARLFFGDQVSARAVIAGLIGVSGLCLLFGAEIDLDAPWDVVRGIGFAALGTLSFSLGNMVSRRNSAAGLPPIDANAWGMGYGALILLALLVLTGQSIGASTDLSYMIALGYLAIIGSVVGFTTYLMMVARMGATQAAYATVLFPIVALSISTFVEGYEWSWIKGLGVALALTGNIIMFSRAKAA